MKVVVRVANPDKDPYSWKMVVEVDGRPIVKLVEPEKWLQAVFRQFVSDSDRKVDTSHYYEPIRTPARRRVTMPAVVRCYAAMLHGDTTYSEEFELE